MIDINSKNMGVNTIYCSDSNGSSEFKCVCYEGFDGTRCEFKCPSEILASCKENETCQSDIDNTTSIKEWKCIDMCATIDCGNGTCIGGTCNCDQKYVNVDNFCEKTCALTPCQESDIFSSLFVNMNGQKL